MDTRFTSVKKVRYPLYKRSSSLKFWLKLLFSPKSDLKNMIADVFQVEKKMVCLFHSESQAIIRILTYHKELNNIDKVYIPAFSCTELADAVISAGCTLVLYEIDKNLNPLKELLESIEGKKNLILILPSLFGLNHFNEDLYHYLETQEYIIIFDEAQSFPITPRICGRSKKKWYSVISFGISKPISSVGGGAIITHFEGNAQDLEVKKNNERYFWNLMDELKGILLNKLSHNHILRKFIKEILKKQKIYDSLEKLQENSVYKNRKPIGISIFQEKCASIRIKDYMKWAENENILLLKEELIKLFCTKFGEDSLKLIKTSIKKQSVFALFINEKRRHEVAVKLSQKGIETTLYYFPIPLIKRYENKYIDAITKCDYKNSKEIIESILILPCNLDYNAKKIEIMIEEMRGVL
jgi:dTDP-4-amino-4,6-dideoxygalactose transaminase